MMNLGIISILFIILLVVATLVGIGLLVGVLLWAARREDKAEKQPS